MLPYGTTPLGARDLPREERRAPPMGEGHSISGRPRHQNQPGLEHNMWKTLEAGCAGLDRVGLRSISNVVPLNTEFLSLLRDALNPHQEVIPRISFGMHPKFNVVTCLLIEPSELPFNRYFEFLFNFTNWLPPDPPWQSRCLNR
eukprot:2287830-Amphidinium_carterae.1